MIIYIEYVLINNFVIDYLLIYLLSITFSVNFSKIRVFFTLCIALCVALFMPYLLYDNIILMIYKILSLCVVILPIKRYRNVKEYIVYLLTTLLYTFLFGGMIVGLLGIFNIEYTISGLVISGVEIPSTFLIIFVAIFIYIFVAIIKYIFAEKNHIKNYLKTTLKIRGKNYQILGYVDTGNFVSYKGHGVIMISNNLYLKILLDNDGKDIRMDSITLMGMSDRYRVPLINIDSMTIGDSEYTDIPCGVSVNTFKNFDCLLHSEYGI